MKRFSIPARYGISFLVETFLVVRTRHSVFPWKLFSVVRTEHLMLPLVLRGGDRTRTCKRRSDLIYSQAGQPIAQHPRDGILHGNDRFPEDTRCVDDTTPRVRHPHRNLIPRPARTVIQQPTFRCSLYLS